MWAREPGARWSLSLVSQQKHNHHPPTLPPPPGNSCCCNHLRKVHVVGRLQSWLLMACIFLRSRSRELHKWDETTFPRRSQFVFHWCFLCRFYRWLELWQWYEYPLKIYYAHSMEEYVISSGGRKGFLLTYIYSVSARGWLPTNNFWKSLSH